jgi:hypothetical protein
VSNAKTKAKQKSFSKSIQSKDAIIRRGVLEKRGRTPSNGRKELLRKSLPDGPETERLLKL